jgi:hypothetical protein
MKRTPGKFIISANPRILGLSLNGTISSAFRDAPDVSKGVAGTHEGNITYTRSGRLALESRIYCMPLIP